MNSFIIFVVCNFGCDFNFWWTFFLSVFLKGFHNIQMKAILIFRQLFLVRLFVTFFLSCLLPYSLPSGSRVQSSNFTARATARVWWDGLDRIITYVVNFFNFRCIKHYTYLEKCPAKILAGWNIRTRWGLARKFFKITI